jgi:hypothetical protein
MRLLLAMGLMLASMPAMAAEAVSALDYARAENWLCRPDASGACDTDLSLTEVTRTGAIELPPPPARPLLVDCFYVYPTVSEQDAGNADPIATEAERYVVQQQFARFGEICRRFAPLYRQTTLASIAGRVKGDPGLAYADVRNAWNHYLRHDNGGRGMILIGHSQGARHLTRLISEDIAGRDVEARIVAAYLIGWPVPFRDPEAATAPNAVPPMLPLCQRPSQTGCTVAYVTFAGSRPPAADNRFAGRPGPGLMIACVNPARLIDTTVLAAIFPARPRAAGSSGFAATLSPQPVQTASYQLSGMIRGECRRGADGQSYLAADSDVPILAKGFEAMDSAMPGWGLHLVDVNIALGNLLALARRQAESWRGRAARSN